ncbi:MAG: polysaccharide deacetylase family protein [Flavobacteriaceae bacterium]
MLKAGLNGLYMTGAHLWLGPATRGRGTVFTLHHVRPDSGDPFSPNRVLEITPDFLDRTLKRLRKAGIDLVSLEEAHRRIVSDKPERRFAAFTLDDGYRDNLEHAAPVFRSNECPYTIFVVTALPDGQLEMWWRGLEMVISNREAIAVEMGERRYFECVDVDEKYATYEAVYWWLRSLDEERKLNAVRELCDRYGVDMTELARQARMTWPEIGRIAADPLCTIGAHTVTHAALARLDESRMLSEMRDSATILEAALGRRPEFFAYPYGDPCSAGPREFAAAQSLGFKMAFTTRPGVIRSTDSGRLTSLPRVSLNGDYQSLHYVDLFVSGVPFALINGLSNRVA